MDKVKELKSLRTHVHVNEANELHQSDQSAIIKTWQLAKLGV